MGDEYSLSHAADITVQLPADARVWAAIRKKQAEEEAREEQERKEKERPFSVPIDEFEQIMQQEWEDEDA